MAVISQVSGREDERCTISGSDLTHAGDAVDPAQVEKSRPRWESMAKTSTPDVPRRLSSVE